jgi:anti-anti-sigma factor
MINLEWSKTDGEVLVFKLNGELKIVTAEESKGKINNEIDEAKPRFTILDLADLTFLDSAGLAAFISAYKHMVSIGGKLYICNLYGQPKTIIDISDMEKIIPVFPTLDEALEHAK